MAAQSSPRKSPAAAPVSGGGNHARHHASTNALRAKSSVPAADFARRKSVVSDPEEMLLLREKLNQIAVGLQFARRATPHDEEDGDAYEGDEEDDEEQSERCRRRRSGPGHFKVFPLLGDRPSTPPSSPQPRDVLRKHMRMRNSSFRLDDLPSHRRGAASSGFDDAMDSVCVDAVDISRLDGSGSSSGAQSQHASPASVRMSIPGHLRVRSASSFSVLTQNPEGLRKRKSSYVDTDTNQNGQDTTPLKKVSSAKNILTSTWDYDALAADLMGNGGSSNSNNQVTRVHKDHEMEDVSPESPDSVVFANEMRKQAGGVSTCT
ncbi:hypothetical protein Gpo141_00002338 [Globisporangium polare]